MRMLLASMLLSAGLFAQIPNSVTATVTLTRNVNVRTAVFTIQFLDTSLSSTVDSAVSALSGVGVSANQLTNVSVDLNQGYIVTTYEFTVKVPADQFTATRDKLITVQRALANSQAQALGWSSTRTPTDDDIIDALNESLADLLLRAKTRAGQLAQTMNATLGPVVALSAPAVSMTGPSATLTLTATYLVGPAQQ